ncbi:hypothetical protein FKM82_013420 [Ascaphus truei]
MSLNSGKNHRGFFKQPFPLFTVEAFFENTNLLLTRLFPSCQCSSFLLLIPEDASCDARSDVASTNFFIKTACLLYMPCVV